MAFHRSLARHDSWRYTCCAVKTLEQFRMVVLDHLQQDDSKLRTATIERSTESVNCRLKYFDLFSMFPTVFQQNVVGMCCSEQQNLEA